MKPIDDPTPAIRSRMRSPSSTQSSTKRLDAARKAAKRILSGYPDYGKAPPEYVVTVTELLATYPESIIWKVADLRTGIASRTEKWLPMSPTSPRLADQYFDQATATQTARPAPGGDARSR